VPLRRARGDRMSHPIMTLQAALVQALRDDPALSGVGVFDAPPAGAERPWIAIARHDVIARDGDLTPGHEHRMLVHVWAAEASRRAALEIAERVVVAAIEFVVTELVVTLRRYDRTDTAIDGATGVARAVVALRFHSEPS
jgi:hypothetical protein